MSIQYAGGTIVNATLTQVAGTRAELAQWIRDQLVVAGWTSAGSATDYQLTSGTTPGGNLQARVRVYDPGSGNCANLKLSNTAGTKTQAGNLFLLPAVSKSWRIIANKFQFFVFTQGITPAREFACGGTVYVPLFLQGIITECVWCQGNALTDTDAVVKATFRTKLGTSGAAATSGNQFSLVNGSTNENSAGTIGIGNSKLLAYGSPYLADSPQLNCYRWHDNSLVVYEPLIGWGLTSFTTECLIRGQLWDSVIVTGSFSNDATITLDSRTYYPVTYTNPGAVSADANGSLFVAVT